jgi:hypothetical protein
MAAELFAAYRAIDDLLFAENVQAKILTCSGTKTYVDVVNGFKCHCCVNRITGSSIQTGG